MDISFKVKLYELMHDNGKVEYKILSPAESKKLMSRKANKKVISKKLIRNIKISVSIRNLAT